MLVHSDPEKKRISVNTKYCLHEGESIFLPCFRVFSLLLLVVFWINLSTSEAAEASASHLSDDFRIKRGNNLSECAQALKSQDGGWCEIRAGKQHPSISSVWPDQLDKKIRMVVGPKSILIAWNSAALDSKRQKLYFMGGGHTDYGGNEVYEFDLNSGRWTRLTTPSKLDYLYVGSDYNKRKNKPWRRLCWMPNTSQTPGSSHTYDGFVFSHKTETIFLYSYGAANGACFEDVEDQYSNSEIVLGSRKASFGLYEFNPSTVELRNGLAPLSWRRIFDHSALRNAKLHNSYPVSAEIAGGDIVFGSKNKTAVFDPANPDARRLRRFTSQADWGDGLQVFDKKRNLIWSLHKKALLAFDGDSGRKIRTIKTPIAHQKALAVNKDGKLILWNGRSGIYVLDPDSKDSTWRLINWGRNGPDKGYGRVYGKWVYLEKEDLFVGLSIHTTGVWVYKHPMNAHYTEYSNLNIQKLIKQAKPGSKVIIPPGTYSRGLFVNKSLTLGLKGVLLGGVANQKGIINVSCNNCRVVIEDFHGDGVKANCQSGNCAGVKAEGRNFNLTLRRVHISRTVMGVLTDNRGGQLFFEDSLIENTGLKDRSSTLGHGLYAGSIDRLVVRNSIIRRAFGDGHILKSRAKETLIENSVIAGLDGFHSRTIDFPCSGKLVIRDSVLQHGENSDNYDLISVGTEPDSCGGSIRPSEVTLEGNWILIDRDLSPDERSAKHGATRLFTWRAPLKSINVSGNRFVESTGQFIFDGEGRVPDLSDQNRFYSSRKEAGLDAVGLPIAGSFNSN